MFYVLDAATLTIDGMTGENIEARNDGGLIHIVSASPSVDSTVTF